MGHFITRCKIHRTIYAQCRCPGPKTETMVPCQAAVCLKKLHVADGPSIYDRVNRFEVIDWRKGDRVGRAFTSHNVRVKADVQDGGRTLKIFITDPMPDFLNEE